MQERRPIPPYVPPPPPETPPPGGTADWARWHLRHTFGPEDAGIIECITLTHKYAYAARLEYVRACHERKWAGWQAQLAWDVIEAILAPLRNPATGEDWANDDIPF